MKRRIIEIDQDRCNGCGLCVDACHEGAIQLINGKAKLIRDDYCDGLGDCLPSCPADAIAFVEREAAPYNEAAVIAEQMRRAREAAHATMPLTGCPGSAARSLERKDASSLSPLEDENDASKEPDSVFNNTQEGKAVPSELRQWPVQIKLVPSTASYLQDAKLLVAADCSAFAYGWFHHDFMKGRICLIGCPKLDGVDYAEKLTEIISKNNIRDVLVVRMQVPCCGGLETAVIRAADACNHSVEVRVITLSAEGTVVSDLKA